MSKRKYPDEPCRACPYIGRAPGWIGAYDDPQEFIELIRGEQEMPCHSAVDYAADNWEVAQWDAPRCLGQLMMANRMAKRFRDPSVAAKQDTCGKADLGPVELVDLHRNDLHKRRPRR